MTRPVGPMRREQDHRLPRRPWKNRPRAKSAGGISRDRTAAGAGIAGALVVPEDERPVVNDRPASCGAELVLMKRRLRLSRRIGEEIVGVQLVVAKELEDRAVELVGAALDRGIDHGARCVAEFRGEGAGLDFEFLHRVHRRHYRDAIPSDRACIGHGIVIDTIQRDFICGKSAAPAIKGRFEPMPNMGVVLPESRPRANAFRPFSGRSRIFLFSITWPSEDVSTSSAAATLLDFDHFTDFAWLQGDADRGRLVHLKHHLVDRGLLEAGDLYADGVLADRQELNTQFAVFIRGSRAARPVPLFVTVMAAPGTIAPLASVTVMLIVPAGYLRLCAV